MGEPNGKTSCSSKSRISSEPTAGPPSRCTLARVRRRAIERLARVGAGRAVVAAALAAYFLSIAVAGKDLWLRLGVAAWPISFLDLRSVTTGWECSDRGIDVLRGNPCDPLQRPFNYPRLWLLPGELGLGPGDTFALGVVLAVLFFGAVLVLAGRASWWRGLVWAAVVTSPPVMLGVERGNIDLAVVVLLAGALVLFRQRAGGARVGAHALFLATGMLKLYPVFGFAVLLRQRSRWLRFGAPAVVGLFVAYALVTLGDLRLINAGTPKGDVLAYGAAVLRDQIVGFGDRSWTSRVLQGLLPAAALGLALVGLRLLRGAALGFAPESDDARADLDAFWVGAGIYVGTYTYLYNADYRLVFLLLTVPQLLRWAAETRPALPLARLGVAALLLTLWFSTVSVDLPAVGWISARWNDAVPVQLDELFGWLLCAYLLAGLCATLPAVLRRLAQP